jgi:hypothetical protein
MPSACVICGRALTEKQRSHAKTCGPKCRKALSRRTRVARAPTPAALPDRETLLARLDRQSAEGSVNATLALLREVPNAPVERDKGEVRRIMALVPPPP